MNSKKIVSIGFIAILLTSFVAILTPSISAASPNWIEVIPPSVFLDNSTNRVGNTFKINVSITVTNLYGFEYKLAWNKTLLQCTSRVVVAPPDWIDLSDPENPVNNYYVAKNTLTSNATHT